MRRKSILPTILLVSLFLAFLPPAWSNPVNTPAIPRSLADLVALPPGAINPKDIARANLLCVQGLPGAESVNIDASLALVETMARKVWQETDRLRPRFWQRPQEFYHSEAYFKMIVLVTVMQEDFGIHYNPARIAPPDKPEPTTKFFADSNDVFINGALGPKRSGTCSSLPVFYVAVGRQLGYPLKLVTAKAHLFLRWEDEREKVKIPGASSGAFDKTSANSIDRHALHPQSRSANQAGASSGVSDPQRMNVEASGRGLSIFPDDHYHKWPFPISAEEEKQGYFLRNLTPAEEVAIFLQARAQVLIVYQRFAEAREAIKLAANLTPQWSEVKKLYVSYVDRVESGPPKPMLLDHRPSIEDDLEARYQAIMRYQRERGAIQPMPNSGIPSAYPNRVPQPYTPPQPMPPPQFPQHLPQPTPGLPQPIRLP